MLNPDIHLYYAKLEWIAKDNPKLKFYCHSIMRAQLPVSYPKVRTRPNAHFFNAMLVNHRLHQSMTEWRQRINNNNFLSLRHYKSSLADIICLVAGNFRG